MSADTRTQGWRRWRETVFATCTAWLFLQNLALFALVAWGNPASAWAAGTAIARAAISLSGQLCVLAFAAVLGLALAAYLVHAPLGEQPEASEEVGDGR